ncbi:MAG: gamma-glutamyl-gamma-aminobutyrate hydrolase family protein [Candidatus Binatia bacterium]
MPRREEEESAEGASWLVFRHTAAEGLGLIQNVLRDLGVQHRYLDLPRGEPLPRDLRGVGGLIVLGGPMAAYEMDQHPFLLAEAGFVEKAMAAGRPVLGICLGAQLIAAVLGARVYAGARREVGWAPVTLTDDGRDDPLFAGAEPELTVFHLHGDTYELPPDGRNLASSALYEQQAFRVGDLVYGFQFHLEFTETIISRLATEPDSRKYIEEAGADPVKLAAESPAFVRTLAEPARRILTEYFRGCGL